VDVIKDVKEVKTVQENHGISLEEVLQRLKNKRKILVHPDGMAHFPLDREFKVEAMEKALNKPANMEYLVSVGMDETRSLCSVVFTHSQLLLICRRRNCLRKEGPM